jgi:hypothetical protein
MEAQNIFNLLYILRSNVTACTVTFAFCLHFFLVLQFRIIVITTDFSDVNSKAETVVYNVYARLPHCILS